LDNFFGAFKVQEGGYFILSEAYIRVRDIDSAKEQLNIFIDSLPSFGSFENTLTGIHVCIENQKLNEKRPNETQIHFFSKKTKLQNHKK
jgi:hypothetical protein